MSLNVTVTWAPYNAVIPAAGVHNVSVTCPATGVFFFHGSINPSGPTLPYSWGFEITFRHTTLGRLLRASVTQQSYQTDIHARWGIRTRIPGKRATADLRLRRRGYWARLYYFCIRLWDFWNLNLSSIFTQTSCNPDGNPVTVSLRQLMYLSLKLLPLTCDWHLETDVLVSGTVCLEILVFERIAA
jgi:hypothetical protein